LKKLSVILPVYNEEEIIENSVRRITEFLDDLGADYELIICDDHSDDGTSSAVRKLCLNNGNIVLLHFDQRIGKGGAIKNALKVAEGNVFVFMDCDLSTNLKHLPQLVEQADETDGVVIGVRDSKAVKRTLTRKFLSSAYNFMVNILFNTGIGDHQCGFKGFSSKAAEQLFHQIRTNGFTFDTELIAVAKRIGIPVTVLPVEWKDNRSNKSTSKVFPLRSAVTMLIDLLIVRFRHIAGKTLIPYREVEVGSFTDETRNKTYPATHMWINVGDQRILSILRRMYLRIAFGRKK